VDLVGSLDHASVPLATFLVEHYWPGITPELFEAASEQVRRYAKQIAGEGVAIRFLHSTLVPEEEAAFCVFEAEDVMAVESAYARAAVRFERIVDAVEIRPGGEAPAPLPSETATTVPRKREEQ